MQRSKTVESSPSCPSTDRYAREPPTNGRSHRERPNPVLAIPTTTLVVQPQAVPHQPSGGAIPHQGIASHASLTKGSPFVKKKQKKTMRHGPADGANIIVTAGLKAAHRSSVQLRESIKLKANGLDAALTCISMDLLSYK